MFFDIKQTVVMKEKDNMGLESNAGIAFHHRG